MLRYGIISASSIVERFMQGAINNGDTVTAIAARDIERARQKGEKFGVKHIFSSYDDVYDCDEVDIVYIANINHLHYAEAKKALQKGKHVLLEKPFVLSSWEVTDLFSLAREKNLFLMEAQKSVFLPATLKARELIEEGAIGKVRFIELASSYKVDKIPWMKENRYGGGTLFGNSIYCVEYLNFFLRTTLKDAKVMSTYFDEGACENTLISFRHKDLLAFSRISSSILCPDGAKFLGSKGYIEIKDYWKARKLFIHYNDPTKEDETLEFPVESEFVYEAAHVRECIERGWTQSPVMSESATYGAIKLIETLQARALCAQQFV